MEIRLRKTTADYLAIAVSPALVMLLVGSLVFFLIEVIYAGQYQARITYVFAWFVFATVLIARISIEMGSERAAMYSVPLGLAVFVVLQTFVEYNTPFSPLINIALIGVVWWCAHRLTWDCTFIEDDQDSSGEGLLDRMGKDENDFPLLRRQANELEHAPPTSPWKRWLLGEGGPHTPGVWVLYFSLAALPLFGLGQRLIPATDEAGRRYAFMLLFIYVAAGLALLVTTSFLGFRRYLRQRQVEMPAPLAFTWVVTGGVLILAIMIIAMLLPRPAAEYTMAKLPWEMTSPDDLEPSRYGIGPDGVERPEAQQTRSTDAPDAPTPGSPEGQQSGGSAEGEPGEQAGSDPNRGQPSQGEQGQPSNGQSPEGQPSQGQQAEGEPSSGQQGPGEGNQPHTNRNQPPADTRSPQGEGEGGDGQDDATTEDSGSSQPKSNWRMPESTPPRSTPQVAQEASRLVGGIVGLVKWLFFLLLLGIFLYFAWKFRRELLAAWRDLVRDIRAWLAGLWGGQSPQPKSGGDEPSRVVRPRRTFHQFRNPFESLEGTKMAPAELVAYTFDALQAWAADRGEPREAEQTPQEFIYAVLAPDRPATDRPATNEARHLASLYNRLAYGDGQISPGEAARLQDVWRLMLSVPPRVSHAG